MHAELKENIKKQLFFLENFIQKFHLYFLDLIICFFKCNKITHLFESIPSQ